MRQRIIAPFEVKFADSSQQVEAGVFSGYGAMFGNVDSYGDVILPGAFKDTLKSWKKRGKLPKMLLQHGGGWAGGADDMVPIGVWTKMEEDDKGLYCEGRLFCLDTERGKYIYEGLKTGELDGLSIGYAVKAFEYGTKPEEPVRTLKKLELYEVSLVTFPANDQALVAEAKAEGLSERDFERLLTRDAGLSRSEAQMVINQGFKAMLAKRDAGAHPLAIPTTNPETDFWRAFAR
jgi:HK97 family phage prohead protease